MSHDVVGDGDSSTIGITSTDPAQQLRGSGGTTDAGEAAGANPDVESEMLTEQAPGEPGFGDGSNRWIPGLVQTLNNPVDRVTNPVDTLKGAADAAALNFDEGVGGLSSLVDDEPGNTAGPGTGSTAEDVDVPLTGVGAADDPGRSAEDNLADTILDGDLGVPPRVILLGVVSVVALILLRPVLQIVAGVSS